MTNEEECDKMSINSLDADDAEVEDYEIEYDRTSNACDSTTAHGTATSERAMIAKKETKKVERFRILLFVFLALVGASICTGTYYVDKESSNDSRLSVSFVHKLYMAEEGGYSIFILLTGIFFESSNCSRTRLKRP